MAPFMDWLRQHLLGTQCPKLVSYDGKTITFTGTSVHAGPVSFDIGKLSYGTEKVREAGDLVQALDNFQYYMCIRWRGSASGTDLKAWYEEQMARATLLITRVQIALVGFQADPKGEHGNLDLAIADTNAQLKAAAGEPTPFPKRPRAKRAPKGARFHDMMSYMVVERAQPSYTGEPGPIAVQVQSILEPSMGTLSAVGVDPSEWGALFPTGGTVGTRS